MMGLKIQMTEKIEWLEGSILKIKRLTVEEKDAIGKKISDSIILDLAQTKLEESAKIELSEKSKLLKSVSDPKKKEELEKEILVLSKIAYKTNANVQSKIGLAVMEASICGWEGIVDENGNEIEFNENNRSTLWNMASQDGDVLDKLVIFHRGPLGNSKAGLTAPSNTDGIQDCADNASETVKK